MRHAMTKFPNCKYVWYLDQHSFIMNPNSRVEDHVMGTEKLQDMMLKEQPIVPPESIIKTFSHLRAGDVNFVITQDKDGLATSSMVLRNGEWAKFFLDTWFDPMYRSYNFQKAETHALVCCPCHRPTYTRCAHTDHLEGTYRPVASHHPFEASDCPTAGHQRIFNG